jgi:hypothetical protein
VPTCGIVAVGASAEGKRRRARGLAGGWQTGPLLCRSAARKMLRTGACNGIQGRGGRKCALCAAPAINTDPYSAAMRLQ